MKQHYRLSRLNYVPRILMLAYAGLILLFTARVDQHAWWFWLSWGAFFLVWPHIAYWRGIFSANPKRAEHQHIALDAFVVGVCAAFVHFQISPMMLFLGGTTLTHMVVGGAASYRVSLGLFVLGALAGGALTGYQVQLDAPASIEVLGSVGVILVMSLIGYNTYHQNRTLIRIKQSIEDKNRIFHSLHQMSILTNQTSGIEDLLSRSLSHFEELMPELGFGIVLHESGRPGLVRYAMFHAIPAEEGKTIAARLKEFKASNYQIAEMEGYGTGRLWIFPMAVHLKQLVGFLVVQSRSELTTDRQGALQLFRDQIASALESRLLTLRLERLASTDPLTGVFNRSYFNTAFEQAVHGKQGVAGIDFTIMMIDVNGLKAVNDRYGHEVGDEVVVRIARLLQDATRETDVIVRMGGDEFVLLCTDCSAASALQVVERIRAAERDTYMTVDLQEGKPVSIGLRISIGSASSDQTAIDDMARTADERMYEDKARYYQLHERYR